MTIEEQQIQQLSLPSGGEWLFATQAELAQQLDRQLVEHAHTHHAEHAEVTYREAEREAIRAADVAEAIVSEEDDRVRGLAWASVDLEAILAGDLGRPEPVVLAREDGRRLLYGGRVHSFIGESESGKTLGSYLACSQELLAGNGVVFVDFEGDATDFVRWMLSLGVSAEVITQRARFVRPDEALDDAGRMALRHSCVAVQPSLVVFDGVTEAMMLHGLDDNRTTDTAKFMALLPREFADAGGSVIIIDHVPHGGDRAIGSQHKRSAVTGASYLFKRRGVLRPGQKGEVDITVRKDRPGTVREFAEGGTRVGKLTIEPAKDSDGVSMRIEPPDGSEGADVEGRVSADVFRFIAENPRASLQQVRDGVEGRSGTIADAVGKLMLAGRVKDVGTNSKHAYEVVPDADDEGVPSFPL